MMIALRLYLILTFQLLRNRTFLIVKKRGGGGLDNNWGLELVRNLTSLQKYPK